MFAVMLATLVVLTFPAVLILSPFIVRKMAELEWFFATTAEGQARPVIWNKKFRKFIMNYAGHIFQGELFKDHRNASFRFDPQEAEYWELIHASQWPRKNKTVIEKLLRLFEGVYLIGVPPFAEIQRYRMTWIEWGYPKKSDGTVSTTKAPISHDEPISHVLVQSDVYFVKVLSAETKEGIPVDVSFLLTISITNPYKALYRVQHWLEAVTNQTEGTTRVYIGTQNIRELFAPPEGDPSTALPVGTIGALSETSSEELAKALHSRLENFKERFGVNVELVQIQSIEPAGDAAAKYRELLTRKYEAEQEAERVRIAADAEAYRIETEAKAKQKAAEMVVGAVSSIPNGPDIFHSQQVGALQNLRTYVEGDRQGKSKKGKKPVIAIPTDSGE